MLAGNEPSLFGFGGSLGNDPNTKLLLHMEGANGGLVFTDSSPAMHTVGSGTTAGIFTSTAQAKFGATSTYFAGNGNSYLAVGTTDWDFGTADFTIDWWEYRLDAADSRPVVVRSTVAQTYMPFLLGYTEAGLLKAYASSNNASWDILTSVSMGALAVNTWVHFAIVRKGTTFYTFRNGTLVSTVTSALAFPAGSGPLCIGIWNISGTQQYIFYGHLDEFRISNVARWTASFLPPKAPYAPDYIADNQTRLLMHFDGGTTVTDSSPYARGAATVVGAGIGVTGAQQKFGGASCTFPGVNQYLQYPDDSAWNFNADFTIDYWIRLNALPATGTVMCPISQYGGDNVNYWMCQINELGTVYFTQQVASVNYQAYSSQNLVAGQWAHVAIVRSSGVTRIYVNGVGGPSFTNPVNPDIAGPLQIGVWATGAFFLNGYLDELRISKNVARWTANFSPPSGPYNPIIMASPVKLLLPMTGIDNTAIFADASPQARGNTTVSGAPKIASNFAKFDGSANSYMSMPDSPDWNVNGDFTVECWAFITAYPAASQAFAFLAQCDGSNTWTLFVNEAGGIYLQCSIAGTYYFPVGPPGPVPLKSWVHCAAVYSVGKVTVYVNGVAGTPVAMPSIPDIANSLIIGAYANGGGAPNMYWMNGFLDDVTVTRTAKYSFNFTPPPTPQTPPGFAAATHFSVTAPANATVGNAFNVTVQALDVANQPTGLYSGTVHITSSDGSATLPANGTLSGGVGTFSVKFNTTGTFTVTATDTVTGSINGTSGNVVAGTGPATPQTIVLGATGTWTVPNDWTPGKNSIEGIGGGGNGGAAGGGGGGGGGGAYSKAINVALTPGTVCNVTVGGVGGTTQLMNSVGTVVCMAVGGGNASGASPGAGGAAASGTGSVKYSGGAGGAGGGNAGAGGGGAGGPNGNGAGGGVGVGGASGGGGGGGNGGGSVGGNSPQNNGGAGGNNSLGAGGGVGGVAGGAENGGAGTNGGGGGGSSWSLGVSTAGGTGGNGIEFDSTHGSGGGGGGSAADVSSGGGGVGGLYGGGGGGGNHIAGAGRQGVICIKYG